MIVKSEIVHTSIYLPKHLHRKLRELAIVNDCKVHDLILRGIQAILLLDGVASLKIKTKETVSKRKAA
jgi:hypothetical protein